MGYQRRVHGDRYNYTSSLIMQVMGFYIVLAVCLLSSTMGAPLFLGVGETVAITATALTITSAAGVVTAIPLATIAAGKIILVKAGVLGALAIGAITDQ